MRQSLIISVVFHSAVVLAVVLGLPDMMSRLEEDISIIPVEVVTLSEERKTPQAEKPQPKMDKEPPAPKAKPIPPRRVEQAVVKQSSTMPLLEDKLPPQEKPEKIDTPDRVPQNVALKQKPRPPSRFDASRLSALLNKKLQNKDDTPEEEVAEPSPQADNKKITHQISRLESLRITAGLQDAIRSQVEPCWSVPAGARDAENLQVRIRIYMRPDGDLARPPVIVDQDRQAMQDDGFYRIAAESARRAIQKCAPLKLPRERYEMWREIELTFDPRKMLGG